MLHAHVLSTIALSTSLLFTSLTSAFARQDVSESMLPAGIAGNVLAAVEIPADALPTGPTAAVLARFTWAANSSDTVPAGTFEKGVLVDVLLEGSYAMRSGGPLLVARSGAVGAPEEIAAGEEAVLATGDAVIYLENDADWEFRNAAPAEPGMALEALIISTDPPALPVESVVDPERVDDDLSLHLDLLGRAEPAEWAEGAKGPLTLTIWRADLAPGATISSPVDGVVQIVAADTGVAPHLAVSPNGGASNLGQETVAVVGMTVGT
jgi:hypothetical protein